MNSCISALELRRILECYFPKWTQPDMWRAHLQTLLWIWKVKAKWEAWGMRHEGETRLAKWKKAQASKKAMEWWVSLRKVSCIVFIKKQKVFIVAMQSLGARASGLFCLLSLRAMHTASLENIFQLCIVASSIKILLNGIVYFWECHNYQQEITGISKCH